MYTCSYCGRQLGQPVAHRCRGNFRKRKLSWQPQAQASPTRPDYKAKQQQLEAQRADVLRQMKPYPGWSKEAVALRAQLDRIDIKLTLIYRFAEPGSMTTRHLAATKRL